MPSRPRRPRTPARLRTALTALVVTLALALAGWALRDAGVLAADADAAPTAAAPAPSATEPAPTATAAPPTGTDPAPTAADPAPTATGGTEPSRASRPTVSTTDPADVARARTQLAALPVKGKAPATGYDREARFGTPWLDLDHNGCDTRNDVLARDLTGIERSGPCTVLRGTLVSPYTGQRVDFVRGDRTSTLVQIDHVVALENAWRTGAQQLSQSERQALANDPENLFAVDQHSNAQKRSGDAATWLPADTGFRCTYVAHQIAVKTTYRLWVAPAEHEAMERVLDRC